ncbi:ATP-dependent DNA helicase srs2 [Amphichorda felina]
MSTPRPEAAILKSLNNAQRRAVTSKSPTVAILAGPGSGKTHTLTSRVVWLIQHMGYLPCNVIVATFTVKAAREMKERINKTLGQEMQKKIVLGTFHSIARRYLTTYGKLIGLDSKFNIADDGDSKAIIKRIIERHRLKVEPSYARSWISKKKARGTSVAQSQKGQKNDEHLDLKICFKEYQDHLERSNLLDYDDLLVRCVELLRRHPSCVSNVQTVLIDEYQDTNGIQYELMKLFAQEKERITIVGDPDQSIYGWRSAEVKNLYRLLRDYPDTDEISLEENYRSSQAILNVSLRVIQEDEKRYQKVLLPVHAKGEQPVLRKLSSSAREGEWIVQEIKRAVMMFGGMLKYEDVAILLRSASLSRHVESALGKAGVAYRMIGGHKFYERKEIKVLIDYLRVIYQPDNNDAVARIINIPRRGIGEATVKSLLEEAEQSNMTVWSVIYKHCRGERQSKTNIRAKMEQKLSSELVRIISSLRQKAETITSSSPFTLVNLVEQLISHLHFKKHLEEEYNIDHEQRWANVQEFVNMVGDFMRDFGRLDEDALPEVADVEQAKNDSALGNFLANVSLASDAQRDDEEHGKSSLVTISTIHAAKGLEWPVVFVPSVYNGIIPHTRSEDVDEERRLLYVAMTRAQAFLYLSSPLYGSQGMGSKVELSSFIAPFASKAFAPKGPSFGRHVLETAGKILQRDVPTEKAIFDKLPPMFSPEDDQYPINPIDPKNFDDADMNLEDHYARAPKRQRTGPMARMAESSRGDDWQREYATTMEQSAGFTMSLPGFVSAGAHQYTIAAANAEKEASNKAAAAKRSTARRPADQKSLLGFVNHGNKIRETGPLDGGRSAMTSFGRHQAAAARSAARLSSGLGSIDPKLADHKVRTGRPLARPVVPKPADDGPQKQYACFSSSPPRPSSPDKVQEEHSAEKVAGDRPATSFHATTFTSVRSQGGIRRPVGMGPPPSMDRLRKPFKPLTINRPRDGYYPTSTMNAITTRLSTPIARAASRRAFSTSAPARANTTTATSTPASSGWWSNLQPQTKRYVAYGVATCAAADSYVVYNYFPHWFGTSKESKQE